MCDLGGLTIELASSAIYVCWVDVVVTVICAGIVSCEVGAEACVFVDEVSVSDTFDSCVADADYVV